MSPHADTKDRVIEDPAVPKKKPSRASRYAGQVLSGSFLTKDNVRRHYPYIFFMAFLMWLYIANVFHIQKLHRQHDGLAEEIKELRSRSLTLSSVRMTSTRRSEIIKELERRGIPLKESTDPPKIIKK